ncbi:TRAP transporter large permease [Nesterenkonia muleiensis]|uniref:TRAP transporter large permease n=1 Tax=Nesterenkonia muleiensis TaxID=2282648 RepID=UPI000E74F786|nr:TRAP transporter large permease [Nesterenkonia muleiensis]
MPAVLGGGLIVLLIIGVPIGIAIGLTSIISLVMFTDVPLEIAAQRLISGVRSFPLLAIPLFILAGSIMNAGGVTQRLIDFAYALIGQMRGALAGVTVITNMIFGGISGSAVADASSVGRLLIPQMLKRGYPAGMAASVSSTASTIALILPPSITMIIYGVTAEVSISALFFHGLYIGLGFGLVYILTGYIVARVMKLPSEKRASAKELWVSFRRAAPALLIPVAVLGGIRLGIFTATEGGAVAVAIALFLGLVVYRELTPTTVHKALHDSAILVAAIMLIIAMSQIYSWALTTGGVAQTITDAVLGITTEMIAILLLVNVLLLLVGTVVEGNAAIILFTPILLPIVTSVGVDPVHFGLIIVINLAIGLITPPAGICLLIGCKIAGIPMEKSLRDLLPWLLVSIALLLTVTYTPLIFGWY